jgi:trans-2,3-dihydro-3-hydroxyanthranilate isomerase
MRIAYHTLDVFTDRIFGGNPLAVFPDATGIPEACLGKIARELNLSESVFVFPATEGGTRRIRIFTPGAEVPFAGHPTIGTAFLLVDEGSAEWTSDPGETVVKIVLEETVGPVPVDVFLEGGRATSARLTTAGAHQEWPLDVEAGALAAMLGLDAADIGVPGGLTGANPTRALEPCFASAGLPFAIVPVRSVEAAGRARLDEATRTRVLGSSPRATFVYVVAPGGDPGVDLHVRMFAPEIGVPEDPATGSACAALGGYLASRLEAEAGEAVWRVEQGIEMGRASILDVDVLTEHGRPTRVRVAGRCVRVARAEMEIAT